MKSHTLHGRVRRTLVFVGLPTRVVMAATIVVKARDTIWMKEVQRVFGTKLKGNLFEMQNRLAKRYASLGIRFEEVADSRTGGFIALHWQRTEQAEGHRQNGEHQRHARRGWNGRHRRNGRVGHNA